MFPSIVAIISLVSAASVVDARLGIIGGQTVSNQRLFNYQASIRWNGSHNCGGCIVHTKHIVTAGHCAAGYKPENLTIVVGSIRLSDTALSYNVSQVFVHEAYNATNLDNDIAVMRIAQEFVFNENVNKIPYNGSFVGGKQLAVVSGWGRTVTTNGTLPEYLQTLNVTTITNAECKRKTNPVNWGFLHPNNLCTTTPSGKGMCFGDSGGPLTYQSYLAAIVSWVVPCGQGYPDAFTRTQPYVSWIDTKIQS